MSTRFTIPVFGAGGARLDSGSQPNDDSAYLAGEPTAVFRDPAMERLEGERRYDEIYCRTFPTLHAAMTSRDRKQTAVKSWIAAFRLLQRQESDLRNLVLRGSLSSEDSVPGSRAERLAAVRLQLSETQAEVEAAYEELAAAEELVEAELRKTPMGAL
jgi:hypothetical protein